MVLTRPAALVRVLRRKLRQPELVRIRSPLLGGDVAPVAEIVLGEAVAQVDVGDGGLRGAVDDDRGEHRPEWVAGLAGVVVSGGREIDAVLDRARVQERRLPAPDGDEKDLRAL